MKIIGNTKTGCYLAEISYKELESLNRFCGRGFSSSPESFDLDISPQIELVESLGDITVSIDYVKESLKNYINKRFPAGE